MGFSEESLKEVCDDDKHVWEERTPLVKTGFFSLSYL